MIAELEKRTREELDEDPAATHLDYAIAWVSSGESITSLAAALGKSTGHDILREALRRHLYSLDEKAEERLDRARALCAHGLIEQSIDIADKAKEEEVGVARLKVQTRQWTAERYNREAFGAPKGALVSISITGLHLDALRARAVIETGVIAAAIPAGDELASVVSIEA